MHIFILKIYLMNYERRKIQKILLAKLTSIEKKLNHARLFMNKDEIEKQEAFMEKEIAFIKRLEAIRIWSMVLKEDAEEDGSIFLEFDKIKKDLEKNEKKMILDKQIEDLIYELGGYKERAENEWKKASWNINFENFYEKYYYHFDGFLQKLYPLRGLDEKTYFKEKSFLLIEEEVKEKIA